MRTPKLIRSKTTVDGPSSAKSNRSHESPMTTEATFRTSFDDLRRPENRQMLRQHLTGQFPESQSTVADELLQGLDVLGRSTAPRNLASLQSGSALQTTSSSSINGSRLSTVRESATTIDVEHAITLLQELKKTASPDQLVALHKALLPTRDSTISLPTGLPVNDELSAARAVPTARNSAYLPAGLATRGGPDTDLLKKQEEAHAEQAVLRQSARDAKIEPKTPSRSRRIGSTDLSTLRNTTPSESDYAEIGVYRRGTLRITNGAASPDAASILETVNNEKCIAVAAAETFYESTNSSFRGEQDAGESQAARISLEHDQPFQHDGPFTSEPATSVESPVEQGRGRPAVVFPISYRLSKQSRATLAHTPSDVPKKLDEVQTECPMAPDMPRFAQRWGHRAQHISDEYIINCVATPFDDEADKDTAMSPADGQTQPDKNKETSHSWLADDVDTINNETVPKASVFMGVEGTPSSDCAQPAKYPSRQLVKSDSGYISDVSTKEPSRVALIVKEIDEKSGPIKPTGHISTDEGVVIDSEAGRGVNVFVADHALLDFTPTTAVSAPPAMAEKKSRPSFFKRASPNPVLSTSANASPTEQSSPSPVDAKKQRKLKKSAPDTRKKKKAEIRAMQDVSLTKFGDYPTVPDQMARIFAGRPDSGIYSPPPPNASFPELWQNDTTAATVESVVKAKRNSPINLTALPRPDLSRGLTTDAIPSSHISPVPQRRLSFSRKRSKSCPRPRSGHGAARSSKSVDIRQFSCNSNSSDGGRDEYIPPFTDIGTTARALGSNPYDVSTNQFRRRVPVPGSLQTQHTLQSPHQIGIISFAGSNKATLIGMEDAAAAELARFKSRDRAVGTLAEIPDRPRVATPRGPRSQKSQKGLSTAAQVDSMSAISTSVRSRVLGLERPQSWYAESIPSLPEIPTRFQQNLDRKEELLARVHGSTARSSAPPAKIGVDDIAESIADVVKKAASQRRAATPKEKVAIEEARALPIRRFQGSAIGMTNHAVAEATSPSSLVNDRTGVQDVQTTAKHLRQHSTPIGWEEQAALWRERRRSIGRSLGHPSAVSEDEEEVQSGLKAPLNDFPSVIRTRPSTGGSQPADPATIHAETYAALIGDASNTDHRPPQEDTERTDSANTFFTARSGDHHDLPALPIVRELPAIPRKHSLPALAVERTLPSVLQDRARRQINYGLQVSTHHSQAKPYTHVVSQISRDRSPGGRVITAAGNFHPYRPMAIAAPTPKRHSPLPNQYSLGIANENSTRPTHALVRPRSFAGLQHSTTATASTAVVGSVAAQGVDTSLLDRYSGGLNFGFERGVGIWAGSAGLKAGGGVGGGVDIGPAGGLVANGLDLGDVPVFLRKV